MEAALYIEKFVPLQPDINRALFRRRPQ